MYFGEETFDMAYDAVTPLSFV